MKRILFIIILLFAMTLPTQTVEAANITITCNQDGPCDMAPTPNEHLFYELNIMPGHSVTRTLNISNTSEAESCTAYIHTKNEHDPDALSGKLWTNIRDGWTDIYGSHYPSGRATSDKKLQDIFGVDDLYLGTIPVSSTSVFIWTVTFDPNTGNEYQNKQTVFDFDATISCGIPPSTTPTATPSPTNTPSNNDDGDDNPDTGSNPPGGDGGGPPPSSPLLSTVLGNFLTPFFPTRDTILPDATTGDVEGTTTEPEPLGDVAGVQACQVCIWWPILVLQAVILSLYFYVMRRKHKKLFWLGGAFLSIFTYIVFLLLNGNCRDGWQLYIYSDVFWCKYFILWTLMVFGLFGRMFRPKKEEDYLVKLETPDAPPPPPKN